MEIYPEEIHLEGETTYPQLIEVHYEGMHFFLDCYVHAEYLRKSKYDYELIESEIEIFGGHAIDDTCKTYEIEDKSELTLLVNNNIIIHG